MIAETFLLVPVLFNRLPPDCGAAKTIRGTADSARSEGKDAVLRSVAGTYGTGHVLPRPV